MDAGFMPIAESTFCLPLIEPVIGFKRASDDWEALMTRVSQVREERVAVPVPVYKSASSGIRDYLSITD